MKARRYVGPQPQQRATALAPKTTVDGGAKAGQSAGEERTAAARNGSDGDAATAITAPAVARSDGGFGHTRPGGRKCRHLGLGGPRGEGEKK